MNRAKRLKRAFGIEIERCTRCGGNLGIIASIEQPEDSLPQARAFTAGPLRE
jgi:hypothetical protein